MTKLFFIAEWMLAGDFKLTFDNPYVVMAAAGGAVIIVVFIAYTRAQARKNEMLRAGQEMGFMQVETNDESLGADVPLFGHSGSIDEAMRGSWGKFECQVLDYGYREGKAHISQTVAVFIKQGINLPAFEVRPAHFGDGLMRAFSSERIKFSENADFEHRYMVHSVAPVEAKAFFQPAMQEYFMGLNENPWTMEVHGDEIVVYRRGKKVPPTELREFVEKTGTVAEGMVERSR